MEPVQVATNDQNTVQNPEVDVREMCFVQFCFGDLRDELGTPLRDRQKHRRGLAAINFQQRAG